MDLDDPDASAALPPAFITPEAPTARSTSGSVTLAVRELPRHHRVEHPSGLLVTTPARTAVDVASGLNVPEALITLDAVARRELLDRAGARQLREHYVRPASLAAACAPLLEAADAAATQFSRATLERVLPLADPRRESALESRSFGHMFVTGFPLPELQARIETPEGPVWVDFLWGEAMVVGEADGLLKYQSEADLHKEKLRQELLEQLGFRVVRWTDREMRDRPGLVLRRIAAALDARAGLRFPA